MSNRFYTAAHPLLARDRIWHEGSESAGYVTQAFPVRVGDRVWIGGGAILMPGVEIGENTTVGAGSVVTKSIPANSFAAGNPCQVIRELH
jgi:maltose O-acetyltransferase